MREEFYDRGNGLGYDNRYRGILNGGVGEGWPSPRGGFGMERDLRERGLGLDVGVGSPRVGEGLGRGRNTLGLGGGLGGGLGAGLGAGA
jgi:hypothetical protein